MKKILLGIFISILGLAGIPFSMKLARESSNYVVARKVDFKQSIENAVHVQGLENKFVYIQRVRFGGAGAGGIGAPQILISSVEQFLSLVPKGEQIYSAVQYQPFPDGSDNEAVVEKVYWAFIENRAGLINYTEPYSYEDKIAENFDSQSAYFRDDDIPWHHSLWFVMILFIGSLIMIVTGGNMVSNGD
jgi:hypothetical protein